MNDWLELHDAHQALRATGGSSLQDIRRVLQQLIKLKHADASLGNRFTWSINKATGLREWYIAAPRRGEDKEKVTEWSEPLWKLASGIAEASLTILALTNAANQLGKLTVMVSGHKAGTKREPFVVAAHLDDRHMGLGACSHALFHCHVGPSLDAVPKVRVPFPALRPAATLEWALSVVLPNWEPVPWQNVVAQAGSRGA